LALVWNYSYETTMKLLYGRAFRAPSFAELFNVNNPVALGNTGLDPETIDTYEWGIDYHPMGDFNTKLNIFYYSMKDIIQFSPITAAPFPRQAQNSGKQIGKGFELESVWDISRTIKLSGNFSFQRSEDNLTNKSAGHAPQQQIYSKLDWQILHNLKTVLQLNWVANRKRVAGDNRPTVDDYTTVDFVLRYSLTNHWEFSLNSKNVFDEDVREPSPVSGPIPANIPNDLPLAGRSIFIEFRYSS